MKNAIQSLLRSIGYSLHRKGTVEDLQSEIEMLRDSLRRARSVVVPEPNVAEAVDQSPDSEPKAGEEFAAAGLGDVALEKLVGEFDFDSVIDIGAGAQAHAEIFARYGKKVTAVDLGTSKFHKHRSSHRHENIREVFGDFNSIAFSEQFDCVWASHILEHQLDVHAFLRKMISILKEGGVLAITVPPLKHEIVGGHVSLWNAGLVLYRLILAGLDCSDASILAYGYNVSVILRKRSFDITSVALDSDAGDIRRLKRFFPQDLAYRSNELDDPFDGDIRRLNWRGDGMRISSPKWASNPAPPTNFYALSLEDRQRLVKSAIDSHQTLMLRWETLSAEATDSWSSRAQRAAQLTGSVSSVADVGCGMMLLERFLPAGTVYLPVDVVRRDERTIVVDLNTSPLPILDTDCVVGLGLLEYIFDVPSLLSRMALFHNVAILSYNPIDDFPAMDQRMGHAWVNHFSIADLENLFQVSGFRIASRIQHDETQTMWRLISECRRDSSRAERW